MRILLDKVKERYSQFYTANGSYRHHLMRLESLNSAKVYDYFSKLTVRLNSISKMQEIKTSTKKSMNELIILIGDLKIQLDELVDKIFAHDSDSLNKVFAEAYDVAASIVEGVEERVCDYLESVDVKKLSEGAQLIQRRTHWRKKHPKNKRRVRAAKMAWRTSKHVYAKSLKKFHLSSQGKQFHRNLSRFNRMKSKKEGKNDLTRDFTEDDALLVCRGISSFLTSSMIQLQGAIIENVESIKSEDKDFVEHMQDVFHIFNEVMVGLFDAYFEKDKEAMSDAVEVVCEYYEIVNKED